MFKEGRPSYAPTAIVSQSAQNAIAHDHIRRSFTVILSANM